VKEENTDIRSSSR